MFYRFYWRTPLLSCCDCGFYSVVSVVILVLLYRIVFVVWKHRDVGLIYCWVNLVLLFAREPKQLTVLSFCRPPHGFIVCCLPFLCRDWIDGSRIAFTPPQTRRESMDVMKRRSMVISTLASYLGSPSFESWPAGWVFWLWDLSWFSSAFPDKYWNGILTRPIYLCVIQYKLLVTERQETWTFLCFHLFSV